MFRRFLQCWAVLWTTMYFLDVLPRWLGLWILNSWEFWCCLLEFAIRGIVRWMPFRFRRFGVLIPSLMILMRALSLRACIAFMLGWFIKLYTFWLISIKVGFTWFWSGQARSWLHIHILGSVWIQVRRAAAKKELWRCRDLQFVDLIWSKAFLVIVLN